MELLSIFLLSLIGLLQMNDTTEIAFVGDAMQHGPQILAADNGNGSYCYDECFTLIENDIKTAHYAVANLECPLGGKPYRGYPMFSAPDDYARALRDAGFDMLVTANNHSTDCGKKGVLRTINVLDSLRIDHVGTYLDGLDRVKRLPYVKYINGIKVAFLSYTYGVNLLGDSSADIVDFINRNRIAEDIRNARQFGAEMVCACVHWGNEYEMYPSKYQRDLAHFLRSLGVDMIIGSHPHVLQPIELDYSMNNGTGNLLVYSLGNFISNQNDVNSRGGAMVKVRLTRYNDSPVIANAESKLFFCQKPRYENKNYKLIPESMGDSVREDSKWAFDLFMKNANALYDRNNKNINITTTTR